MGLRTFLGLRRTPDPTPDANRHGLREGRSAFGRHLRGSEALDRFVALEDVRTVLDIGSGAGVHAGHMRRAGKAVTCLSLIEPADVLGDYAGYRPGHAFDGIWASHVLEHQPDPSRFLRKCFADLREGGALAVSVPPMKPELVGGHLALWTPGLLLYHLIVAGFDCAEARLGSYDYDISVIVRKRAADLPADLHFDEGDIEKLARFFPLPVHQGIDGRFADVNW